jgi:NAD(P)-dependent dehydrogenase (short-subunit alcohol dehydrogenase family)
MGKLENKIAIVTGGGTGIGRSIALSFAKEGATIVVCGRTVSTLEKVNEEIKALGKQSLTVPADVSIKEQVQNVVKQTITKFSKIDILVNNAGVSHRNLITDMPEEDWDTVIDINLKGVFLCIQAVARHMIEHNYGKIINISSIAGIRPTREAMSAYDVSKAGVIQLTKSATLELTRFGINVNCIAPGIIETPIYRRGRTPEQIEGVLTASRGAPIGRIGDPQEIANVALLLASEDSSFLCGETVVVDGGINIKMS